jgi:Flp pilus assembly protein TadG
MKIKKHINAVISTIFVVVLCCFSSCRDDVFSTDPNHRLSFSTDTVNFDVVFSTVTSSTRRILVYNRNNQALRISEIGLKEGANSVFRINVNGEASANNRFSNIEISARDSMFIFVNVNVAELGQDAPLFIEDHLFFNTNGTIQQIVLETYGQDVEFLRGLVIQNDTTLTANKPYVIFNHLAIIAEKTLTLEPGTRLFFHNNADLVVFGNLIAEGTFENPIILRGNRFDNIPSGVISSHPVPYNFVAGQWGRLYLLGNGTHRMAHVNINSGEVGVYLSANVSHIPNSDEMPTLEIVNCKIHNHLFHGLYVLNANVTVTNTEISNTRNSTVYLNGGTHIFVHTTIANYFNSGVSAVQPQGRDTSEPAVMIMNLNRSTPMKTVFLNSVIAGSVDTEFSLATRFPEEYNGVFRNTYIKRSPLEFPQFSEVDTIRWDERNDTIFQSTALNFTKNQFYNFEPDSVSPLLRLADPAITFSPEFARFNLRFDLNGNDRTESDKPASGAYEWRAIRDDE